MTEYGAPEGSVEDAEDTEDAAEVEAAAEESDGRVEDAEETRVVEVVEAVDVVEVVQTAGGLESTEVIETVVETVAVVETTETTETVDGGEDGEETEEPGESEELQDDEIEAPFEGPVDPQEWINQLIQVLLNAEQGIGAGPRDALMARIKLAQAYSEIGDPVSAAPLAVENVLQAEQLFPASESWLRGLRDFRDAVCEAAGWSASQMRQAEPEPEFVPATESEPVAVYEPVAAYEPEPAAEPEPEQAQAQGWETEQGFEPAAEFVPQAEQAERAEQAEQPVEFVEEFVTAPPSEADFVAEFVLGGPAEWEIEPLFVEETLSVTELVERGIGSDGTGSASQADDGAEFVISDAAAYEEIIRLRYELRDARRTIDRLRHINTKLREALAYDED